MMTDTLADMLTRIRNAVRTERPVVDMPASKLKVGVAEVLKAEGFIIDYHLGRLVETEHGEHFERTEEGTLGPKPVLRIFLKYGPQGERVIRQIDRVSRPGCRIYRGYAELRPVLDGLGIAVLSTSQGVLSDRQARAQRLGGEVLCTVW